MEEQKISSESAMSMPPLHAIFPTISVIIPMYNVEKYVSECLDSLLAQTFQNFEVIVVDDCSTDNSAAIVESYREKFGGRLEQITLQTNSGNAGYTARNRGFYFSRGEYVFFIDGDDFISKNALEILYNAAKKFDADVIYTSSRYHYTAENGAELKRDRIGLALAKKGVKEKPELVINDSKKILKQMTIDGGFFWTPWTKFSKRSFLIKNEIIFPEILSGGDTIWTVELFTCMERFLRLPNAIYFWRDDSQNSTTRTARPADKQIEFWLLASISWIQAMKNFSLKFEYLKTNPIYGYGMTNKQFEFFLRRCAEARAQFSSDEICEFLRDDFAKKFGEFGSVILYLYTFIDARQKELQELKTQHAALKKTADKYKKATAKYKKRVAELEAEIKRLKAKE